MKLGRWLAGFLVIASLLLPTAARAATNTVSLSPSIQDMVLSPAATTVDFKVQLFNNTSGPLDFELRTADFTTIGQSGSLVFSDKPVERGLANSLRLNTDKITINGGSVQTVTATIDDATKLSPGGHYGAVVARVVSPVASGGNRVSLKQDVSALLFVQTAGQGTRGLELLKPDVRRWQLVLPQQLPLVFRATGNTQVVPRGIVNISRSGQVIMRGQLNNDSAMVLPGSSRLLETNLKGNKYYLLPGKYDLDIEYRYDGSLGTSTYHATFWYLPLGLLITCGLLLAVLLWLLLRWQRAALRKLFTRPPRAKKRQKSAKKSKRHQPKKTPSTVLKQDHVFKVIRPRTLLHEHEPPRRKKKRR
jgi:hypothetical protein